MRLADIKIGESYYYWNQEWVAEMIEKADKGAGIWQSGVICRSRKSGERRKLSARMLSPWVDYLREEQMYQEEVKEVAEAVKRLTDAVGQGAAYEEPVDSTYISVMFTEEAAARVLESCGAKPLPDDKKPSKAYDDEQFVERSSKLSQRIRRALGVGYAGQSMGYSLLREHGEYHARIYLYGEEVKQAADKIMGIEPAEEQSALSELIG